MPRPSPRFNKPVEKVREEGLLVPPPSALLMDHLWEAYGVRPAGYTSDTHAGIIAGESHKQSGREEVLNYLQSLVDDRSPSKEG